jgi:hypothetical protein
VTASATSGAGMALSCQCAPLWCSCEVERFNAPFLPIEVGPYSTSETACGESAHAQVSSETAT